MTLVQSKDKKMTETKEICLYVAIFILVLSIMGIYNYLKKLISGTFLKKDTSQSMKLSE
jgi:hypothetical protein